MKRDSRHSLFWTIAGLFILVAVVGTLLQALVAVAVLGPLSQSEDRSRVEVALNGLISELVTVLPMSPTSIDTLLERHRRTLLPRAPWLFFRQSNGVVYSNPPGRERFASGILDGTHVPPPTTDPAGHAVNWNRLELLAREPVMRGSERLGELVAIRPVRPDDTSGSLGRLTPLLFLPIALILSMAAALVLLRLLVRRLRAIETLAARVAEGDLSVRIADPSGDEIGRLAERLDHMAQSLFEARERVEQSDRQRRQLFADITHELATPLTSIRGYAETLLDPQVNVSGDERGRFVRGVLEEARRLDRLIRDLFDLARLEAGATQLQRERLDWVALCRNTAERFSARFSDAGLRMEWGETIPEAWIHADGHRMEQVLENLLGNALRYVPVGGKVALSLTGTNGAGTYRLRVDDDGPGLSNEELSHVFERFYRAPGARGSASRDGGGSGLGLAIVREIVERHGGSVRAEATRPHGLAITIELPRQR